MKAKSFLPFLALDVAVDVCPSLIETMYCLLHLHKSIANSHRPVHPVIETLRKRIDFAFACDIAAPQVDEKLLAPTLKALSPIANISVESLVLYHTPKSSYSYWDAEQESHVFSTKDLPLFVNSNEWHLDTSIAAGGWSKILQFVVYIPLANECPLRLQLPNGEISVTNGFISPCSNARLFSLVYTNC
ncbi:hypothetical protein LXL04_011619 [Taraxacum kok-saghyz]